jgi:hypothetical protein
MRIAFIICSSFLILLSTACRKGELIGREVQIGDNDILLLTSDSFHISARTIEAERERTDERFEGMLGAYKDPTFGSSVISYVSQYNLEKEGFVFPSGAVFDSAFVSFRLTGGYREKDLDAEVKSLMHFQVYELSEDILLENIYYSDEKTKTKPNLIGEFNGLVGLFDSVYVGGTSQPPQIRIKLDNQWGENLMMADSSNYATNEAFVQYMKGLKILPIQTNQTNSNGAIYYFNPLSGFTNITLHYHTSNDTTKFSFITNSLTANFTTFEHDYSNSAIANILNDTAKGSEKLYLQATIGTDVQIELKDIAAKFAANPKVINLAELYIPVDTNEPYYPLVKLSVSRKLENGTAEFLPDQVETGDRVIDGSFDAANSRYRFRITQYVQEIIQNYTPGSNQSEILLISPFGNNTLANRSVINGPRPSSPDAEKLKIVITYTPLK